MQEGDLKKKKDSKEMGVNLTQLAKPAFLAWRVLHIPQLGIYGGRVKSVKSVYNPLFSSFSKS